MTEQPTQLEKDQELIDDIDTSDADLNTKDADFIDSCIKRLARGQELSVAQRKWAQDIADRIA